MTTRRRAATMGSTAGAPPDRAAGLAAFDLGVRPAPQLPADPPMPAAPLHAQANPVPPDSETAQSPADQPERPPDHTPAPPRKQHRSRTAPPTPTKISPRIPATLFQQINDARERTGETHEAWFLRIAETVAEQIPALYPRRSSGATFPQRVARRRRAPGGEPLVQYPLRLTPDEQAPLQAWQRDLPVSSMSELITSIVRLGLAEALTLDETR